MTKLINGIVCFCVVTITGIVTFPVWVALMLRGAAVIVAQACYSAMTHRPLKDIHVQVESYWLYWWNGLKTVYRGFYQGQEMSSPRNSHAFWQEALWAVLVWGGPAVYLLVQCGGIHHIITYYQWYVGSCLLVLLSTVLGVVVWRNVRDAKNKTERDEEQMRLHQESARKERELQAEKERQRRELSDLHRIENDVMPCQVALRQGGSVVLKKEGVSLTIGQVFADHIQDLSIVFQGKVGPPASGTLKEARVSSTLSVVACSHVVTATVLWIREDRACLQLSSAASEKK